MSKPKPKCSECDSSKIQVIDDGHSYCCGKCGHIWDKIDTPRNAYNTAMWKRHKGNQKHRAKSEKRKKNPKNNWRYNWDD